MLKYRHSFQEIKSDESSFLFKSENINARLDFLENDIYRVALYKDGSRIVPTFGVCPGDSQMGRLGRERLSTTGFSTTSVPYTVQDSIEEAYDNMGNNRRYCFNLGDYNLMLYLPTFFLELYTRDGRLLMSDRPYSPYNYDGELGDGAGHFITAERYEKIFGLGEKSGNVNKFGRSFTIGARDSMGYDASSTDPLYKHLPYYICQNSVGTYGIYYDTHARSTLNFMEEMDNYYGHFKSFTSDDEVLVYYVFLGDIKHIASRFAWFVGRSVFSPKWSLDYCGSTMTYTDADNANEQLLGFLDKCKKNDLRVSGFYLSSGYTSIGNRRYVFNWNTDKIPDPKKLIATYNNAGVHFIPNIKPAFLEDHPLYDEIATKGYFLHYPDGTPAKMPFWDGYGSYLDFTNPEAFDFWTSMVKKQLIDYGIDAIWNDNNEFYIADKSVMAHGFGEEIPAYLICQVFTTLMVMASNEALPKDGQRYFMSTRSGCAGVNRLAQTWTGDNYTSFRDLKYNHKMALGMNLSGMALLGHDIGGFSGSKPDPELFMRWLQYGVLLPRFTVHSWNDDHTVTEPWMYPELLKNVQELYKFRYRIKPYLYHLLHEVHENYDTFMTPLFVDYPEADCESDAFLLGHDLLAAPVLNSGASSVDLVLPGSGWYCDTSERYYPAGQARFMCDLASLPVLLHKEGSVFVEDTSRYTTDHTNSEELLFTIYPLKEGSFTSMIYTDEGYKAFNCQCSADSVEVTTDAALKLKLVDKMGRKLVVKGEEA